MVKKISTSPERYTFQANSYIKRCTEKGLEPKSDYLDLYAHYKELDETWAATEHQNNLEYDLRTTEWILDKVRSSDRYAQNLYAALCNNDFQKRDVWPILRDETWGCSWRSAGGIIANMQEQGDYIDWYCSGIGDGLGNGDADGSRGYVPEGHVTDEIASDLDRLGWLVIEPSDDL